MKRFINNFNKIDTNILKKNPFRWILGWHKFLPIMLGLAIFAALLAFLVPTRIYTYSDDDGLQYAATFIGFLSFMGFVLYVVRQVKFNSFRIHHHIPFAKSIMIFFSFWLIITLFTIPAFIPHQIYSWRVKQEVNRITDDFDKDLEILHKGSPFFMASNLDERVRELLNTSSKDDENIVLEEQIQSAQIYYDDINEHSSVQELRNAQDVHFYKDEVRIKRPNWFYYHATSGNYYPKTISKTEALKHIEQFVVVAKKYDIPLMETNALKIYNKRKQHYSAPSNRVYSLIGTTYDEHKDSENRYSRMIQNFNNEMNSSIEIDVVLGILIFSILLALLLWIFVSVPLADFGFSILASVLIMIAMGIATAIVASLGAGDDEIRWLFIVVLVVIFLFAFLGNQSKRLTQILKIVSHYLVPVFLFLFFLELHGIYYINYEYEFRYFTIIFFTGILASIFVYKKIFKNYRLLPK